MTGIGAIFELYESFRGPKKEKVKEEVHLEPDPEEQAEGYIDEDSEWHYIVLNKDWDGLLEALQQYDYQKYKPKEKDKKKRRLRVVKAAYYIKEKVRPAKEEEIFVSPLLAINEEGETPLHMSINQLAPDRYVIRMIFCEKRAALIADGKGRLPLHLACLHARNTQVIDRLIRSNFQHMQREDDEGRTALWYAVDQAKMRAAEDAALHNSERYWGIPRSRPEAEWQERQEHIWNRVKFILLSYSTRRKVLVEAEREILLQVVEHAAPPTVVEVIVLAAQGMLHKDPTLASSALNIFMRREYPIKNLQLLLHHFPEQNVESMEAARKILTNQYHRGCRTVPGRKLNYRQEMERHALEGGTFKRSLPCQEWWDKIICLLRLCGHGNNKENKKQFGPKHLLHAALSNCDCPPSLVQLLMVMNPESIKLQHPFNDSLLIHLICRNWRFNLHPHSKNIGVQLEMEEPPMEQVLKIVLASDPTLARKRYRDRLPLHQAVATSKSMDFLEGILQVDRKALAIRDPDTKLYPFQLASLTNVNKNAALWAHAQCAPEVWKTLDPEERSRTVDQVCDQQELEQLSTVFSLLRKFPAAVTSGALLRRPAVFRDTQGKGMISAHYLVVLYARGGMDENWILQKSALAFMHDAINSKTIPEELEAWWHKLKFWIRYCYAGDQELPLEDEYLLHAAVANSDTPSLVIELLLAMYPESASIPVNGETQYPLHIAAATPTYRPQYFELIESKNVLELLVRAYPDAATVQSPSGLPIDIAQAQGKKEDEYRPLMQGAIAEIIMDLRGTIDEEIDLNAPMTAPDLVEDDSFSLDDSQMTDTTPNKEYNC